MPITGFAQQGGGRVVVLGAQFQANDIPDAQDAVGTLGAHHDVAELFWGNESALGGHRVDQLLAVGSRFLTDLTGGVLLVLRRDGIRDVGGGHPQLRHAIGLEPDPHG